MQTSTQYRSGIAVASFCMNILRDAVL